MSRQILYTSKISSIKKKREREIYSNIYIWQVEREKCCRTHTHTHTYTRASTFRDTVETQRQMRRHLLWQKPSLLVRQDNYSAERSALRSFRRGNTCSQFSATRGIYAHGERYIYLYAACQDTWYGTSQPCQRLFIFATLSSLSLSLATARFFPLQIIRYALRKRVNDTSHAS